jgi:transcriptional regulator with XRE-family HTH domain
MNIGNKIRSMRKMKGLSQKELCEGICSQGMLSQIEKNQHISNINLLAKLCNRLEITLDELDVHTVTELHIKQDLKEVSASLFYQRKYEELYHLIKSHKLDTYFFTKTDRQLILFYEALYYGFIKEEHHKSYEMLEESLSLTFHSKKQQLTYNEILIINNLAIMMIKLNMLKDGFAYFELILSNVEKNPKIENEDKLTIVFFNIANAYSKNGKYEKALEIAIKGIEWANKPNISTQIRLSYLYYEKAYNEQKLGYPNYMESYKIAYYLSINAKDDMLKKFIQSKIIVD